MSDVSQGPGWWQASDGKWYPPEQAPAAQPAMPSAAPGAYGAAAGPIGPNGAPLATWAQRAVGFLIDLGCVLAVVIAGAILAAILGAVSTTLGLLMWFVVYAISIAFGLYIAYLNGTTGQSPGKAMTGLKVIHKDTGQTIGGGMGIVRYIAHTLDSVICYIGWLFPLWDEQRQTISDKLMSTVVVTGEPTKSFGPELFK